MEASFNRSGHQHGYQHPPATQTHHENAAAAYSGNQVPMDHQPGSPMPTSVTQPAYRIDDAHSPDMRRPAVTQAQGSPGQFSQQMDGEYAAANGSYSSPTQSYPYAPHQHQQQYQQQQQTYPQVAPQGHVLITQIYDSLVNRGDRSPLAGSTNQDAGYQQHHQQQRESTTVYGGIAQGHQSPHYPSQDHTQAASYGRHPGTQQHQHQQQPQYDVYSPPAQPRHPQQHPVTYPPPPPVDDQHHRWQHDPKATEPSSPVPQQQQQHQHQQYQYQGYSPAAAATVGAYQQPSSPAPPAHVHPQPTSSAYEYGHSQGSSVAPQYVHQYAHQTRAADGGVPASPQAHEGHHVSQMGDGYGKVMYHTGDGRLVPVPAAGGVSATHGEMDGDRQPGVTAGAGAGVGGGAGREVKQVEEQRDSDISLIGYISAAPYRQKGEQQHTTGTGGVSVGQMPASSSADVDGYSYSTRNHSPAYPHATPSYPQQPSVTEQAYPPEPQLPPFRPDIPSQPVATPAAAAATAAAPSVIPCLSQLAAIPPVAVPATAGADGQPAVAALPLSVLHPQMVGMGVNPLIYYMNIAYQAGVAIGSGKGGPPPPSTLGPRPPAYTNGEEAGDGDGEGEGEGEGSRSSGSGDDDDAVKAEVRRRLQQVHPTIPSSPSVPDGPSAPPPPPRSSSPAAPPVRALPRACATPSDASRVSNDPFATPSKHSSISSQRSPPKGPAAAAAATTTAEAATQSQPNGVTGPPQGTPHTQQQQPAAVVNNPVVDPAVSSRTRTRSSTDTGSDIRHVAPPIPPPQAHPHSHHQSQPQPAVASGSFPRSNDSGPPSKTTKGARLSGRHQGEGILETPRGDDRRPRFRNDPPQAPSRNEPRDRPTVPLGQRDAAPTADAPATFDPTKGLLPLPDPQPPSMSRHRGPPDQPQPQPPPPPPPRGADWGNTSPPLVYDGHPPQRYPPNVRTGGRGRGLPMGRGDQAHAAAGGGLPEWDGSVGSDWSRERERERDRESSKERKKIEADRLLAEMRKKNRQWEERYKEVQEDERKAKEETATARRLAKVSCLGVRNIPTVGLDETAVPPFSPSSAAPAPPPPPPPSKPPPPPPTEQMPMAKAERRQVEADTHASPRVPIAEDSPSAQREQLRSDRLKQQEHQQQHGDAPNHEGGSHHHQQQQPPPPPPPAAAHGGGSRDHLSPQDVGEARQARHEQGAIPPPHRGGRGGFHKRGGDMRGRGGRHRTDQQQHQEWQKLPRTEERQMRGDERGPVHAEERGQIVGRGSGRGRGIVGEGQGRGAMHSRGSGRGGSGASGGRGKAGTDDDW
ncbi:unnamed protein product [Vitrella brassicaformis CCMP3155]|uniref:Uncharacterized protein n=1 Tax=Vitrella brassicaformis (strain CCMP3155) TaxID=1169540 RepID=A0A0G4H899_VITBC|nr:unnamed protein product [Vitrella brassicaformis CCMP3155]|eukprot:CEM40050.1 unnamed protein product [Vitrella brassicaformis CCMP3155]